MHTVIHFVWVSAKFDTCTVASVNGTYIAAYTVIRSVRVSAKFGTCTVVSVNGTHVEDKMRKFKSECELFSFNECPIYTHDGASAKFSTNLQGDG
jgi:hypothetical protein